MTAGFATLRELLHHRAIHNKNDLAYAFLVGDQVRERWRYADLHRAVAAAGARLDAAGAVGRRALLVYPQGLDFIAAFLACLCRNVVAVPVPAPETWNLLRTMPRLRAVARDADAALVLASRKMSTLAATAATLWDFDAVPWMVTDELDTDGIAAAGPSAHADALGGGPIDQDAPAYFQYTSGSTNAPSGVVITHRNLMHHLAALHASCGYGDGVTVTWMPHFHDYGLVQGLLQPLFSGDPCYFMSPLSFLRKPAHWLGAISRYRGTHAQAPNFAYEQCLRRISPAERSALDLSSWKAAGNAAEPINPETLERFIATFAPVGFRRQSCAPAYGLAEATLLVSSTRPGAGPCVLAVDAQALGEGRVAPATPGQPARQVVGCGAPVGVTKVAIVDPDTLTRCEPDAIGEIWVSDPAVAAGYWGQPDRTAAIFAARLRDSGEGPWLRTGDLGFLRDGHLFISGRLKDMIIVRGANFAPQDIEWISQRSHPAVDGAECAAFALTADGAESFGIVQELNSKALPADLDPEAVARAILEAISLEFEIRPAVVALVKRAGVPKTSSGKIQRRACRAALLDGYLETVYQLKDKSVTRLMDGAT